MDNNQSNSRSKSNEEIAGGDTAVQKAESSSHFKRNLVPLNEYAEREGISPDILEQQGQLGVIQIRKFKGQKFVVDVSAEQLSEFETNDFAEAAAKTIKPRVTTASNLFTAGLTVGFIIIVTSVFWLYMDTKIKLDNLNAEYTNIQKRYNELTSENQSLKGMQEQLVGAKAEFARIHLNKTKQNLDAIQGQMSLSRVEIESIQNSLNESKNQLDTLYRQNSDAGVK
jgi:hypothetical protein